MNTLFQNLSTLALKIPEKPEGDKRPAKKLLAVKLNYNDLVSRSKEELEDIFNTLICWGNPEGSTPENVLNAKLYQEVGTNFILSELLDRMSQKLLSEVEDEAAREFFKPHHWAIIFMSGCDFKIYNIRPIYSDELTIDAFLGVNGDFKLGPDGIPYPTCFDALAQLPVFQVISFNDYATAVPQEIEDEFESKALNIYDTEFKPLQSNFHTVFGLYSVAVAPITGLPYDDVLSVEGRNLTRGEIEMIQIKQMIVILSKIGKSGNPYSVLPMLCKTLEIPEEYFSRILILVNAYLDVLEESREDEEDPASLLKALFGLAGG